MSKILLVFLLLQLAAAATVLQKRYFGFNKALKRDYPYAKYHQRVFEDSIPKAWDWRDHGYVTPAKQQGQCESCYIFSALEALEGQWRRVHGVLYSLSEQNVLDCDRLDDGCHGGGDMTNVYDFVKREGGVDAEATYPYVAHEEGQCSYNASAKVASITSFTIVNATDDDLLHALATVGPVSVAVDASTWPVPFYGGIFDGAGCDPDSTDHGVLLVGYGSEDGVPFWIIKNSWGADWGENGYIRLRRDIPNICGITSEATYPNV